MSRLRSFFLTEMPKTRQEPMWATLDWASQQKGTFTMRDLYNVYVRNGGRADALGDNYQSFTSGMMKHVARFWKDPPKNQLSDQRPILAITRGSTGKGGKNPTVMRWGLDAPLRDPSTAKFVNPSDEDEGAGEAMDRLENMLGSEKLIAAMKRWKTLPNLNAVVADIKASIPKKGQMDALHIASEFLMDRGKVDQGDVEDAEDAMASPGQAPASYDDDDDMGDFSSEPDMGDEDDFGDEDEPVAPPPPPPVSKRKPPTPPPAAPVAPPPQPEPEEPEDDEDDIEEPTTKQAGASNFLKPAAPAPSAPAKKSSIGSLMKKFKK